MPDPYSTTHVTAAAPSGLILSHPAKMTPAMSVKSPVANCRNTCRRSGGQGRVIRAADVSVPARAG
jgi:hypothetical protein